ncbi:MAG: methyl-accepting chemotaxis protein [Mariprofundaceae bacterium]|nr:methyl-accepting chemotaxis protein [Mariprofundaceae bacterium]
MIKTKKTKKMIKNLQKIVEQQKGTLAAIDKVMATIEFELDGTIITANHNFLEALSYTLDEVQGQHHRLFVTAEYQESSAYKKFWKKLNKGEFIADKFMRLGKGGKEVWIQASYNPIRNEQGDVYKVIKFATDVTEETLRSADDAGQLHAIDQVMGTIEFELDGTVITANDNFLNVLGYSLKKIQGEHHSMFVTDEYRESSAYTKFWKRLNKGEFIADQFLRMGKGGKKVWIQASYNPIRDANGRIYKVVKFATDITKQKALDDELKQAMNEVQTVLKAVSKQDLCLEVNGNYSGELSELKHAVNDTVHSLRDIVLNIQKGSKEVALGSTEMVAGNQTLSNRTQEQAAALEETAASLEEMTGTVQQNAKNAQAASVLATNTQEQAKNGGEIVHDAIEAMSQITQSSNQINDIIGVIDEIAFQTNLLALNAAVEAARAGEQGRGFAVVAGEVRTLAQRSASAAKEIKDLIRTSVKNVNEGSSLVNQSGIALNDIVASVQKVGDIISEISIAEQEQAMGIEQINSAVTAMDTAVQQNSALVEETAAASANLNEQAKAMSDQVASFRLTN